MMNLKECGGGLYPGPTNVGSLRHLDKTSTCQTYLHKRNSTLMLKHMCPVKRGPCIHTTYKFVFDICRETEKGSRVRNKFNQFLCSVALICRASQMSEWVELLSPLCIPPFSCWHRGSQDIRSPDPVSRVQAGEPAVPDIWDHPIDPSNLGEASDFILNCLV
jgi:hypothetical protein